MEVPADAKSLEAWLERVSNEEEIRSYMQELARLYEILYSDVTAVLKKCLVMDGKEDVKPMISEQRNRLRMIIKYLNRDRDPFVSCMKKSSFLKQYLIELEALERMMSVTYRLEKSKANTQQRLGQRVYSAITLNRNANRSEFSLKKEIKNSSRRCLRVKSGTELKTVCSSELQKTPQIANAESLQQMMLSFKLKRTELENLLREIISRPNRCEVTFEKKYEDLAGYFQKRLEFTDFYLGETYMQQIRQQMVPQQSEPVLQAAEPSPFLTEFNVKTKSLKPNIKRKIDEAIRDVKMQLIDQFHANRTNKFMEINTEQHIELVKPRRLKSSPRCESSQSLTREANKWTRETGRTNSTRVSTAQATRPPTRQYRNHIPGPEFEIDTRLLQRLKHSTYR